MVYVFLSLSIALFLLAIKAFGLVPRVKDVVAATRAALVTIKSDALSEEEKETAVQKAALAMFGAFFSILIRTLLILGLPLALVISGSSVLGLYSLDEALRSAGEWPFLLGATVVTIGVMALAR